MAVLTAERMAVVQQGLNNPVRRDEIVGYYDLAGVGHEDRLALIRVLRQFFDAEFAGKLPLDAEHWEDLRLIWGESLTNACCCAKRNALDEEFISFLIHVSNGRIILKIVNSTDLDDLTIVPDCNILKDSGRGCWIVDTLSQEFTSGKVWRTLLPQAEVDLFCILVL